MDISRLFKRHKPSEKYKLQESREFGLFAATSLELEKYLNKWCSFNECLWNEQLKRSFKFWYLILRLVFVSYHVFCHLKIIFIVQFLFFFSHLGL